MRLWILTRKDLELLIRDRRALMLLIVLPMLFITILGMSTGQFLTARPDGQLERLVIVDEVPSDLSRELIQNLKGYHGISVLSAPHAERARQMLDKGGATVALIIGPEFEDRVEELRLADLLDSHRGRLANGCDSLQMTVEAAPAYANRQGVIAALLFAETLRTIMPTVARKFGPARVWMNQRDADFRSSESGTVDVEQLIDREAKKLPAPRGGGVYLVIVPAYTVMFVFFMVTLMARSFIAERDQGTLNRLLTTPITPTELLLGKTLPFFLLSVAQTATLFLSGRLLFGMSLGPNPIWLVPMIVSTSLAATSLGLLVATVVKTEQQVTAYGTSLVILLAGISGCFLPRDWLPPLMQRISLATPHAWALLGFDAVIAKRTVDGLFVSGCCAMLVAFAIGFLLVGRSRLR